MDTIDANQIQVLSSSNVYVLQLNEVLKQLKLQEIVNKKLQSELEYERALRECGETPIENPQKRSSYKRMEVTEDNKTYSDFKSNGVRKPHAADSIRSYQDFKAIQDYFLNKNSIRDWALWTIGVSLGLRVSDLLSLRFYNLIENDKSDFRNRIMIYEQKTGKLQNCLITDSVKEALTKYLDSINWKFDIDGYLFPSRKTGGKMYEEHGWRILSSAGKALHLPLNIGSHTMRKSFANIAACVDKTSIDMNTITKVQGLLNHSDQKSTMRYLGTFQIMFDNARVAVSDFVLGKSNITDIRPGFQYSLEDLFEKFDELEKQVLL